MTSITTRQLIVGGLKAGVGLAVLHQFSARPVIAASVSYERASSPGFHEAYERLDKFIARHLNETGAPGMTLALANRERLLRTSQYGFADVKAGLRVQPETLFEIGSISKSFVAIAILQLAENLSVPGGVGRLCRPLTF
ncbi:MAG: serine hydrolase domain-containing protein [bacterium]